MVKLTTVPFSGSLVTWTVPPWASTRYFTMFIPRPVPEIAVLEVSANKCIRGVPGASFAVVSNRFIQEIEACRISTFYGGFLRHLNAEDKGETPFTPAVQVFYALRETLEDGIDGRIKRYLAVAKRLRDGLRAVGLAFYIPEAVMSNTMTTVYLPGGFGYEALHDRCKQNGYVIYPSQGDLAGKTFRVGTVGIISDSDIDNFLNVLRLIILP